MTRSEKGVVGVDNNSRARHDGSKLNGSEFNKSEVDGGEFDSEIGKKGQKRSKSKNLSKFKKTLRSDFFTPKARLVFIELRQAFVKASILHYCDPERYIWVETDASGYAIGRDFSQLTLDDLGQWHPVVFFSQKMILAKTRYETHNGEILAIVEAFKTWRHYIEGSQHEVFVLIDYINLCRFMDTKSLSSRQVCWAKELSCYYFQIDYY